MSSFENKFHTRLIRSIFDAIDCKMALLIENE